MVHKKYDLYQKRYVVEGAKIKKIENRQIAHTRFDYFAVLQSISHPPINRKELQFSNSNKDET